MRQACRPPALRPSLPGYRDLPVLGLPIAGKSVAGNATMPCTTRSEESRPKLDLTAAPW
jgi:hypothetical protein